MGNTEIRLNPDKVQAIITDLTNFRNQKIGPSITKVTEANEDVSSPCDLGTFKLNAGSHSENLKNKIADLQTCLDAAKAANDCGITTKKPDGTIAYIVADGHSETIENIKKDNPIDDWHAAKKDAADLVNASEKGISPEDWDSLLQRVQSKQDDPEYAAIMLNTIGPGRLLDLPIDIQERFPKPLSTKGEYNGESPRPHAGMDLAGVFGHLISTGSQGWSDSRAIAYADRLVQYAGEKNKGARVESLNAILSASRGQDIDGDGTNETVGLDYNDAFLSELAHRLESFKSQGGYDRRTAPNGRTNVFGNASNSLEGVVHAMTGNPDAAEKWLTVRSSDGTVDTGKTADRTQSLIKKATGDGWVLSGTWSDQWEEDWLMLAAEHAVRGMEDSGGGPQHAAVTSAVLNTIGENAEHKSWANTDYMTLTERGRNAASIALASYPYAIQTTASSTSEIEKGWVSENDGNSWARGKNAQGKNYQPVIHTKALRSLLGEVGQDNAAVARYVSSQELFNKIQLNTAISGGEDSNKIKSILNNQAAARGFTSGSIVSQSKNIDADTNARVAALGEVTGMAISAIPLPQAKAGGAALSVGTKFAMNFGKAAASKAADASVNGLYGKGDNAEEIKSNGKQANVEFQTLSALQTVYTQDERKRILKTNTGTSLTSIIGPNGELKVDPKLANPYGDGNEDNKSNDTDKDDKDDKDFHGLTPEQRQALAHLAEEIPTDEGDAIPEKDAPAMREHRAMNDFKHDREDAYGSGFDNAMNN
ncbi:DUF6571 family protein [Actinomyces oris]|uniref:DUF6571 family protein n=1 Tax=Actinomyces oris TaxID=544580 RepID=UPI000AD2E08E|nr:DUF6571 family protein [Actinomyces oris]